MTSLRIAAASLFVALVALVALTVAASPSAMDRVSASDIGWGAQTPAPTDVPPSNRQGDIGWG